jgi:excinuclease UvrABC nuclease subunit
MLNLDREARFDPAGADDFLDALPPHPAVVLIEPRADLVGARPLLLRTADLRRRLRLLLGARDPASKRVNLREYAAGVRYRITGSAFEQALVQWQHACTLWPRAYRERLRLRPPPMVKLALANAYPRAYVTRRVGADALQNTLHRNSPSSRRGLYFGPFASRRAAEAFLVPLLDLFRMRRCQIKIRRDPAFPGCIYSEMKMCLAPCFAGCTDEEYAHEVAQVAAFLNSRGASYAGDLARERESASAALDFERAAGLHHRLDKVEAVRRVIPELARPLDGLDAVVLQRAAEESTVAAFVLRGGRIAEPFLLHFAELASQPRSAEQILRDVLEPSGPDPAKSNAADSSLPATNASESCAELEDHLALLARWFFGRPREGEIFFAEAKSTWPYRRILRACSRVLARQPERQP